VAVAAFGGYWNDTNFYSFGDGAVYRSPDSGATWTRTSAPTNYWTSVASSADGAKLVAVAQPDSEGDGAIYRSLDSGANWTRTSAPINYWTSVASSADGTKLVATSDWELIYTSTNSGTTWTPTSAPSNSWSAVASSADGTKLVAVASPGAVYTSSDSGGTWAPTSAPSNRWHSVASSSGGDRLVAVAARGFLGNTNYDGDGLIYTSSDSGTTWTQISAPSNYWTSVASSADGAKLVAVAGPDPFWNGPNWGDLGDGFIYTSGNSGVTWSPTGAPSNFWTSVASSADGVKLVAAAHWSSEIYTSSNSGATWTPTSAPSNYWTSVASSSDGDKLVAVGSGPYPNWLYIYISMNSGATWTAADTPATFGDWSAVASSADGSNIVAVGHNAICLLRSPAPAPPLPPSPQLAVGLSGTTLGLSWLVPSTRFVLQQNSDLSSTNWVEVPTLPTLDLTNLHQRLTLTPSLGSSFFRLKQQ
jgi:hypothetical protein